MPPRKEDKKERKPHTSKDFTAFLIVLPLVNGDIVLAQKVISELRAAKVF